MIPGHKGVSVSKKTRQMINNNDKFNKFINKKIFKLKAELNTRVKSKTRVARIMAAPRRNNAFSPTINRVAPIMTINQRHFSPVPRQYQSPKKKQTSKQMACNNNSTIPAINAKNTFALSNRAFSPAVRKGLPSTSFKIMKHKSDRNVVSPLSLHLYLQVAVLTSIDATHYLQWE